MELGYFGERLAKLRTAKGVSAREMSLSIGQSENYINKIENRKTLPSFTVFFYICEYLGISPQDFFDENNNDPAQLTELITDLKRLDEKALSNIAEVVKKMLGKR